MYARKIIIRILMLMTLSSLTFATTCSYDAFAQSCSKCSFDQYGKMDEACRDGYQSEAKTCLGKDFPVMSGKYLIGMCPQIDECISKLTACKDANNPGTNKQECSNLASQNCFAKADMCAEAANKICAEGKTEEEAGWNNLDNASTAEQPAQNETQPNMTQPNITQPSPYENMTQQEAAWNLGNFLCPDLYIVIAIVLAALFVRNK